MMPRSRIRQLNPLAKNEPLAWLLLGSLLLISGYMTWQGVFGFIQEGLGGATDGQFQNDKVFWGSLFVVSALTLAMFYALRVALQPPGIIKFVLALTVYVLLALFSIGFGYGYWWALFSGKGATDDSLNTSVETLEGQVDLSQETLEAISRNFSRAAVRSSEQSNIEREVGGTCGDGSGAGPGPRTRYRAFSAYKLNEAATFVSKWRSGLTSKIDTFKADIEKARAKSSKNAGELDEKKVLFRMANSAIVAIQKYNSFKLQSFQTTHIGGSEGLGKISETLMIERGQPNFRCTDVQLSDQISVAIKSLAELPELKADRVVFAEGTDATAQSVERLWGSVGCFVAGSSRPKLSGAQASDTTELASNASEFTSSQQNQTQGWSTACFRPLYEERGEDLSALIAAIGVDFSLFVFTLLSMPYALSAYGSHQPLKWMKRSVPPVRAFRHNLIEILESLQFDQSKEARKLILRCMFYASSHSWVHKWLPSWAIDLFLPSHSGSYFLAPNAEKAPAEKRPIVEPLNILTALFVETGGATPVNLRTPSPAKEEALKRLRGLGWENPTSSDFELYRFRRRDYPSLALLLKNLKIRPVSQMQVHEQPDFMPTQSVEADKTEKRRMPLDVLLKEFGIEEDPSPRANGDTVVKQQARTKSEASDGDETGQSRASEDPPATEQQPSSKGEGDGEDSENVARSQNEASDQQEPVTPSPPAAEIDQGSPTSHEDQPKKTVSEHKREVDQKVLDMIDNAERHISWLKDRIALGQAEPEALEDAKILQQVLEDGLRKDDIVVTGRVGEPFDPRYHHAVDRKPSTRPKGEIISVGRLGFIKRVDEGDGEQRSILIRDAQVIVSSGEPPSTGDAAI